MYNVKWHKELHKPNPSTCTCKYGHGGSECPCRGIPICTDKHITEFLWQKSCSRKFTMSAKPKMSIIEFLSSETPGSPGRYIWRNRNRQISTRSEREMKSQPILATNTKMTKWVKTRFSAPPNQEVHNLTSWTSVRSPANRSLESERRREFLNRLRFDAQTSNLAFSYPYGGVHCFDRLPGGGWTYVCVNWKWLELNWIHAHAKWPNGHWIWNIQNI